MKLAEIIVRKNSITKLFNMRNFFRFKHFANKFSMDWLMALIKILELQPFIIANEFNIDNVFCLENIHIASMLMFKCSISQKCPFRATSCTNVLAMYLQLKKSLI